MTNFRRELDNQGCCNAWQHGIRTINGQYPDDNREFGIVEGAGILITPTTAGIKITNTTDPGALEAGQNIVLTPSGDKLIIGTTDDIRVNGDLNVDGDIFQQGASYETHMEQVYTTDDYITMRDGAVTGLSSGQYAGFQVKKYDGTNDGRLVIDNTGTARVGDVGDEQPLLTRAESANLINGQLFLWDAVNSKAVGQSIASAPDPNSAAPITSAGVYNAIKSEDITNQVTINTSYITGVRVYRSGNVVTISITGGSTPNSTNGYIVMSGLPPAIGGQATHIGQYDGVHVGMILVDTLGQCQLWSIANTSGAIYESLTYICA